MVARLAWRYFENNYQPATGMVNAVDRHESTTIWDVGSTIAATAAAREIGLIDEKTFDDRITILLATLLRLPLFEGEAFNKAYNTRTLEMVDYFNRPTLHGVGYSALDLSRLASALQVLARSSPKHGASAKQVLERWSYCQMIRGGQMFGRTRDARTGVVTTVQEGRLGYEQYGGKAFATLGFDMSIAKSYRNRFVEKVTVDGITIAYDRRDPRKSGAYNYIATESFALELLELGIGDDNREVIHSIFDVQKRRWAKTGIVTAVSEDNLDRAPYFVYNTIFAAGVPWSTITEQGPGQDRFKSLSTKAAFSLAVFRPEDEYAAVLRDAISSAYDPERGWYSGIYENGLGYNRAVTASTNGMVLQTVAFRLPATSRRPSGASAIGLYRNDGEEPARSRCLPPTPGANTPRLHGRLAAADSRASVERVAARMSPLGRVRGESKRRPQWSR